MFLLLAQLLGLGEVLLGVDFFVFDGWYHHSLFTIEGLLPLVKVFQQLGLIRRRDLVVIDLLLQPRVNLLHTFVACIFKLCVVVSISLNDLDSFAEVADLIALVNPLKVDLLDGNVVVRSHCCFIFQFRFKLAVLSVDELREVGHFVHRVELAVELPVLLSELQQVFFIPFAPIALCGFLSVEFVTELLRVRAMLDKALKLFLVLFAILLVFVRVVSLETYRKEFQCSFLRAYGGVLQSSIAQLCQHSHHDVAEMVLQEGSAITALGYLLQLTFLVEFNWKLILQFGEFVGCRVS